MTQIAVQSPPGRSRTRAAVLAASLLVSTVVTSAQTAPKVPLCAGLTIVTAVSQKDGDYESIKTIESISGGTVRLKYSSERMHQDLFSAEPPKLQRTVVYRKLRVEDLNSANLYLQQFYEKLPELVPGTTAVGISTESLRTLKTAGEAEIGIFNPFNGEPSLDRDMHPNVYDFQMLAKIQRVKPEPVPVSLLVNGALVTLPAIQAQGDFFGDKSEFFFLDEPSNPIALKFRIGIGLGRVLDENSEARGDRDTLQVIKISYRCEGAAPATAGGLEQTLLSAKRVDVYDLYFSFDSDRIRDESEPRLKEIADVLKRHPDWRLSVQGHTDNIASDAYNLDLSKRRAAAVKDALVKRYGIQPARLTTGGMGESQPRDSNDTLEGRARNRRVELMRL